MIAAQLQSHLDSAQSLLEANHLDAAMREAELVVDHCWMMGDSQIAAALPLLSTIRHAHGVTQSVFSELDELPRSLSSDLVAEATILHEESSNDASSSMLSDLNDFLGTWLGEGHGYDLLPAEENEVDEKVDELIAQIERLKAEGNKKLAVEVALELANEYALRKMNRRACKLYKQVLKKSKRYNQTEVRIDGLLDFGQFFSRLGMGEEAERVLRLAAGVARKAADQDRFARVMVALGVVLAHGGKESAERYLLKANSMVSLWDVEAGIVSHHLEAIREGKSCGCPRIENPSTSSGIDKD